MTAPVSLHLPMISSAVRPTTSGSKGNPQGAGTARDQRRRGAPLFVAEGAFANGTWEVVVVPEPTTALLLGLGMIGLGMRNAAGYPASSRSRT